MIFNYQKYVYYSVLFLTIILKSCHTSKFEQEKYLINSFFKAKEEYLECFSKTLIGEKRKNLVIKWEKIMRHQDKILSYLFSLENDHSYSLYGDGTLEDNPITVQRLSNHFHALYLIECIIRNDYLFNRRFFNSTIQKKLFFFNDASNLITMRQNISKNDLEIRLRIKINLNDYKTTYKLAWDVYKDWFKNEYKLNKKIGSKLPLNGTNLCWKEFSLLFVGRKTPTIKEWKEMGMYGDTLVIGNGR